LSTCELVAALPVEIDAYELVARLEREAGA
jgi:hypothetical protein